MVVREINLKGFGPEIGEKLIRVDLKTGLRVSTFVNDFSLFFAGVEKNANFRQRFKKSAITTKLFL